jgi:hypothetical protein
MSKIKIPIPEGIKSQVELVHQLLTIENQDLAQYFVAPGHPTDPAYRGAQEQFQIDYMMREHKVIRSCPYKSGANVREEYEVFFIYWVYPDYECRHENFYVPDEEYNAKYNKVLFPDAPQTELEQQSEAIPDVG